MTRTVNVRAYSSSANLGPGFDALAIALDVFYDEARVTVEPGRGVVKVLSIKGPYAGESGGGATASAAARKLLEILGIDYIDVYIDLYKGIPPGRGLGSSGASAAASVKALATLLKEDIDTGLLIEAAGYGEAEASGSPHYDNVSASLLGGLAVVAQARRGIKAFSIHLDAWFTVVIPMDPVPPGKTGVMRSVLPPTIPLAQAAANWSRLALLVAAASRGDLRVMGEMMSQDYIVEPHRSKYIPCYREVRERLLGGGALGFAISGAGPSMIALAEDKSHAEELSVLAVDACNWKVTPMVKVAKTGDAAHLV